MNFPLIGLITFHNQATMSERSRRHQRIGVLGVIFVLIGLAAFHIAFFPPVVENSDRNTELSGSRYKEFKEYFKSEHESPESFNWFTYLPSTGCPLDLQLADEEKIVVGSKWLTEDGQCIEVVEYIDPAEWVWHFHSGRQRRTHVPGGSS